MSEKTVKAHRAQVMEKMQVSSVAQLVLLAEKVGLTALQGLTILATKSNIEHFPE